MSPVYFYDGAATGSSLWHSRPVVGGAVTDGERDFPARYEAVQRLGEGAGGEVWSARDRVDGQLVAVKLLHRDAREGQVLSLVREATVLGGVEGLGVPRVLHFGRLVGSGRMYMVRELVVGDSLADLLATGAAGHRCLETVARAAEQISLLHRALLLHGDIKPANIIAAADGSVTLVDWGLAARWHEGGARPAGLTPRYAAPELFVGEVLTPRAEVFALGASGAEVMAHAAADLDDEVRVAVTHVLQRATHRTAAERYPSADEFAQALCHALGLSGGAAVGRRRVWSIVGLEDVHTALLRQASALPASGGLLLAGASGAGKTSLARRLCWSLGVAGRLVVWLDAAGDAPFEQRLSRALGAAAATQATFIVDDAHHLPNKDLQHLDGLRQRGARLILVVSPQTIAHLPGATFALFQLPPLNEQHAAALVRRMIPSLSDALVSHILTRTGRLPGVMRALIHKLEGSAVATIEDIERRLDEVPVPPGLVVEPAAIHRLLDRGRFDRAADYLRAYRDDSSVVIALARAKLATGRGKPQEALSNLRAVQAQLPASGKLLARWSLQMARALLRKGAYHDAEEHAKEALGQLGVGVEVKPGIEAAAGTLVAESLAVCGLTQSLGARHQEAAATLERSVMVAREAADERTLAVTLGSLAFALQRDDKLDEAQRAHEEALALAEAAGDAGHIATTRLNLAGIHKTRGDVAAALAHLEAAVDMGRRSGRVSTVRQALLNLANLNLYLGRQARAQASIDALRAERALLNRGALAQLLALEAELASLVGQLQLAVEKCTACARAYRAMQRPVDAAEALLERVLVEVRIDGANAASLQELLFEAKLLLDDSAAHRPLMWLARGLVAQLAADNGQAQQAFLQAIEAARSSGQREWLWRAHQNCAAVMHAEADVEGAVQQRRAALSIVEQIASELPRDLREVYWNHPRRRRLLLVSSPAPSSLRLQCRDSSEVAAAPTELGQLGQQRLARVLEINRAIAGEHNLDRLLEKVTDHAIELIGAERGFVLLRSKTGKQRLSVHAARARRGDEPHARFSQSIAERVVETGEAFVALDAAGDERVRSYVSEHSLMLRSVACVPIRSRSLVIGALYLETRLRAAALFEDERATLAALADQVAIAIETARLVNENRQRAAELEHANRQLEVAHARLEELLGRRTQQLQHTKRSLRSARAVLHGHFGYRGIVGTSAVMRRVYAVIDRVKDTDVPLLLTGESGTGKEVVARAVHKSGGRAKQRFVGVNCGAIPEHLLESELFGHVRGAFTGADRDKKGLFRELAAGTILLDEVGEMPAKMQAGLLRVLQEKVVRPIGGTEELPVNARVIAATHRHLETMVSEGTFREDLYYRLNVIEIRVPPLRERLEDIPLLVDHFLRIFAARHKRPRRTVSREALKRLSDYSWPGNVRQLENLLLNAWILSDGVELSVADFEFPGEGALSRPPVSSRRACPETASDAHQDERQRIISALQSCNWNRAKAALQIGMPRRTFYRRLKKYGIQ